ncbi:MAG: hypothetical protein ACREUQ_01060, partial [Burkholderiales bacterium]
VAILRGKLSELARKYDQAEMAMRKARKFFAYRDKQANYDFIDRIENPAQQGSPDLDAIAQLLRTILDGRRRDVQSLGTNKLRAFYEHYFPHIWKDRKKAQEFFGAFFGRRPLEGPKSFLKKRAYPTFQDGLDAGLEPVSDNPIELVMLKIREMDRYVMAHEALNEWKESGLAKFVPQGGHGPSGWKKIDDPIGAVWGPRIQNISEFPNKGLYEPMAKLATDFGIKHERGFKMGGHRTALGYAVKGGGIRTRHGTAEDVLAHEIGHHLDWKYDTGDRFVDFPGGTLSKMLRQATADLKSQNPDIRKAARAQLANYKAAVKKRIQMNKELRELADARGGRKAYVRSRPEKMAAIVQAWVGARELFESVAPTVYGEWIKFMDERAALKPLRDIEGSMQHMKLEQPYDVGGLPLVGNWYGPEGAVRALDNYLMPGLRSKSAIFRGALGINNVMNQFQLGFSAFHLMNTTIDAMTSKFGLAINEAVTGRPVRALKSAIAAPAEPVTAILRGHKLLREWYKPGAGGAPMGAIVKAMVTAGGRARMDEHYATHIGENMIRAFKTGKLAGAAVRLPFAIAEAAAKPIMEWIVPRVKLGVFADLAASELERLGPNANFDKVRETLQKTWDVVDDRLGEVVYDNYFWNRYARDAMHLAVRSVGWNLGTLRVILGGAKDWIEQPARAALGKNPEFTLRMGYLIAFPLVTAALGAIVMKLMTGKGPEGLKDYVFPQSGDVDESGRPRRIALPTYMKDVLHLGTEPVKTLMSKASSFVTVAADMLANEDFFGTKIRNEDDPIVQQLKDSVAHAAKSFTPFGFTSYQRAKELETRPAMQWLPFVGLVPAPASLNQTKAERLAYEIMREKMPEGGRMKEVAERAKILAQVRRRTAQGKELPAEAKKAMEQGRITPQQQATAVAEARFTSLERTFRRLTLEEALKVWAKATPEEREGLRPLLQRKRASLISRPARERQRLSDEIQRAVNQ